MAAFDDMRDGLERLTRSVAEKEDRIFKLSEALSSIRYHFDSAMIHLEKVAEELKRSASDG